MKTCVVQIIKSNFTIYQKNPAKIEKKECLKPWGFSGSPCHFQLRILQRHLHLRAGRKLLQSPNSMKFPQSMARAHALKGNITIQDEQNYILVQVSFSLHLTATETLCAQRKLREPCRVCRQCFKSNHPWHVSNTRRTPWNSKQPCESLRKHQESFTKFLYQTSASNF